MLVSPDPSRADTIAAHELTHGLQDQHFDLTTFLRGTKDAPLNADEQIARRFVTEGAAMFTAIVHGVFVKTGEKELTGTQVRLIKRELAKFDVMDARAMAVAITRQMATAKVADAEIQRSLDAMPSIPLAILEPLLAPYMKGASLVVAAYEDGGWGAVDRLYTTPPRSTAEALHPREFHTHDRRFAPMEPPRALELPAFDEQEVDLLETDVLGELMWGVYFGRWKHTGAVHPEAGWNGDRFAVWREEDGNTVVLLATAWDTTGDAEEFFAAYRSTLDARYPDRTPRQGEQVRDRVWMRIAGNRVLIVDGLTTNVLDELERAPAP